MTDRPTTEAGRALSRDYPDATLIDTVKAHRVEVSFRGREYDGLTCSCGEYRGDESWHDHLLRILEGARHG